MGGVYTRADRKSDLAQLYNRIVDRDAGNAAAPGLQVTWTQFDGSVPSVNGSTARTNQATHLIRNTGGHHARILLAATDPSATLTAANCVWLVDDAFAGVGAGVPLRLYGSGGTNYAQLTGDNNGLLSLGGVGVNAGVVLVARLLASTSVEVGAGQATVGAVRLTNNTGMFTRNFANTADVQTVLVDASNIVTLGDAVNSPTAQMQALTNAILKIGAVNVVTATASLLSSTVSVAIGATPATVGAIRLTNATGIFARNNANIGNITLLSTNSGDQLLLGDGTTNPNTIVLAATDVRLRIAATDVAIFGATALTLPVGQIAFPSTQLPSAGVNVLDDYTEGTWTPVLGGSATYSAQVGTFIKIGRTVHVYCRFQVNAIGTGNTSTISGLPYAAAQRSAGYVSAASALAVAVTCLSIDIANGSTTAQLNGLTAAATSYAAVAGFGAATAITFTATYITAN